MARTTDPEPEEAEEQSNGKVPDLPDSHVAVSLKQADEVVARLTAVRGALLDHLDDNPVIFQGVQALLDFIAQICKGLRSRVLGAGSGPLQDLVVKDINERLHEVNFAKHFTPDSFEAKIKQMNGYQAHVASPELAMRALVSDAFADAVPVAQWMVVQMRTFLAGAAKEAATDVMERDPEKRTELADTIVMGINEVLDEWEAEANEMAGMLMEMEQLTVSAVFFQRLALKRRQRGLTAPTGEATTRFGRAAASLRSSGKGFMQKVGGVFRRSKGGGADEEDAPPARRRPAPPRRRGPAAIAEEDEDGDDASERASSSRGGGKPRASEASFAKKKAAAPRRAGGAGGGAYSPHAAKSVAFVQHLPKWENLAPVMLRSGDSQFQVLKGKLSKKAHASGVKASVTKSWSERFFIFDYSNGDLFYWKEQPTAEFCKSNSDAEHYKGTRCVLARAKLLAASADDMKGFSGDARLGVCIENVYVKGKVDQLIVAFASPNDHKMFVRHVGPQLQKLEQQAAPEPEEEEEEEAGEDEDGGDEGEDEVAPETPERDDDAASAGDDGDEAAMEDEEEEPDSPTTGYQRGGLGMGSRFFSADDVKDASGVARIVSSIIVPSQFRAPAVRSRSANGDAAGETEVVERMRVEGADALQWLCSDMSIYVTIVTDTVSATLPKMAVMVLCERIVSSELQRQLQKRALQWSHAVTDGGDGAPKVLHSKEVCERALGDIEEEMVNVRMAASSARLAASLQDTKPSELRCAVSVRALALANDARVLAAAQKPSAETFVEENYGPLFPSDALEASESGARRLVAMQDAADRPRGTTQLAPDPLAPAVGYAPAAPAGDKKGGKEEAMREGKRSGFSNSVVSSVAEIANKTRGGWTGRKRVTDADVEAEHRAMASGEPQSRPQLRAQPAREGAGSSGGAAPAAAAAAKPQLVPADGDPLGDPLGGRGRGPAMGFGTDPLAAPQRAMPASSSAPDMNARNGADSAEDEDEADEEEVATQPGARLGPMRGPRRAAPAGPAPPPSRSAPPRRAPPGPGGSYAPGRPAPLRATPGRPAPVPPARGPPMRPAPQRGPPTRDDLPL